jgi:hypothetical protein
MDNGYGRDDQLEKKRTDAWSVINRSDRLLLL